MKIFAVCLFNAFVLAGTAYLVFWRDASAWWFVGALLVLASYEVKASS